MPSSAPRLAPKVSKQKCVTKDCENHRGEGVFFANMCGPCYTFIVQGVGSNNQVVRNASMLLDRRFNENLQSAKLSAEAALASIKAALGFIKVRE